jgi:DNA-binding beta-propeller fold protein YncE
MPTPLQATASPTSTATLNVPTIIPANTIQSTPVPWHFVVSITGDESDLLRSTTGIALDAQNNAYVIDAPAERIQKFDSQGNFVLKWGSPGEGEGQFDFNGWASLTVDHEGNVYTTEQGNYRVQKFDANGNFLQTFGSFGSDDGRFSRPFGITVDPQGYIYVGDMGRRNIQKFDSQGRFVATWTGPADGERFSGPRHMASDKEGNIYVADTRTVRKLDGEGQLLLTLDSCGEHSKINPPAVAVDDAGNIYFSDEASSYICKFNSEGNFLIQYGNVGVEDGEILRPYCIATDAKGRIYVTDSQRRVQIFQQT